MAIAVETIPTTNVSRRKPGLRGWTLMAPLLVWLAAFVVAPNLIMLVYSFSQKQGPAGVKLGFGFHNYARIFEPPTLQVAGFSLLIGSIAGASIYLLGRLIGLRRSAFRWALAAFVIGFWLLFHVNIFDLPLGTGSDAKILWRSIEYAALTTVLCLIVGYPVAYFIGRAPDKWRNRLLLLVMIPFWTSFLIRTYAWINILSTNGLLNGFLVGYLHVLTDPLDLNQTPTAVIISLVYNYVPFMILPIYGSVEKLDHSLVEAALDLGANPLRTFSQVILPLTRPGIIAGVLLVFIPAIGMYAVIDLVSGSQIITIGTQIHDQFIGASGNWPYGSALGMTVLLLFAFAYAISTRKGPISAN